MTAISIPIPSGFMEWVWFAIGLNFGRAFGKHTDQSIQRTSWFKRRHDLWKWIIKRLLDATHHWWIGALMMLYLSNPITISGITFNTNQELYWFGAGLFIDDLPDLPRRAKEILKDFKKMAMRRK